MKKIKDSVSMNRKPPPFVGGGELLGDWFEYQRTDETFREVGK